MMDTFAIASSSSNAALAFDSFEGDYFSVQLSTPVLSARRRIYAYTDSSALVALFEQLASQDKPWPDVVSWKSIESDLKVAFRCDSVGHVFLVVELSGYEAEPWHCTYELQFDFGQLRAIASAAGKFFRERS
jgi:hypothetical protein